ncbi:amidase [Ruegeria arenilitoris]|uniref:amidase n=1 Tax=Ruegeria arenilitoris TaxID=1173585 RepID=UPI001479CA11|nr:amidase [Ruegeria arenilitoris]
METAAPEPTADLDLCYMSATEALAAFRMGRLKPSTLLQALIERIEQVNPVINALADTYFDEARQQALAADAAYEDGSAKGALLGVPVLVKDAQRVKGKRTTHGSLLHMDAAPDEMSDPMIERLQDAGAIILARTTVPEFCISGVCRSLAWGDTVNPFNPDYGTGGSSGGSGAGLAAGFAPIATGTDIGGSIRIPASCCGVVGFKPPHGRNPDGPPANFDRYNHCGPLARSIADLALVQDVVSGAHPRDHDSLRETVVLSREPGRLDGVKIAFSMDLGYCPVDPEVRRNTLTALEHFRALGAEITDVDVPWTRTCDAAATHWYNTMHYLRQASWAAKTHADQLNDYTLAAAKGVEATTLDDVSRSWETQHDMYQFFGALMERFDLFLCPTTTIPAVTADHDATARDFEIDGVQVDPEYGWILTHHFNMLHHCPVLAVPSGFATTGVPTGLQIVGRTFDDPTVFRAALAYEAQVGGWFRTPKTRPMS